MDDQFSSEALRAVLGNRPFRLFDTVASTQDIARNWALSEAPPRMGAVVIAEHQTAGRGRQGRGWHSPPGTSIMTSVIVRPVLPPERFTRLTMAAGLAVLDALPQALQSASTLKWPNDVLLRGRKVAGILCEAAWLGETLQAVVIGIGINVRVDFTGTGLSSTATSIEPELRAKVNRTDILARLLTRLDHWVSFAGEPVLLDAYRHRLGTLGKRVRVYTDPYKSQSEWYGAIAEGIEEDGALRVKLDSGEVRLILAGNVGLAEV